MGEITWFFIGVVVAAYVFPTIIFWLLNQEDDDEKLTLWEMIKKQVAFVRGLRLW